LRVFPKGVMIAKWAGFLKHKFKEAGQISGKINQVKRRKIF